MTPTEAQGASARIPLRAGISSFAFGWAAQHPTSPFDEQALIAFARRHAVPVVQIADNLALHTMDEGRVTAFVAAAHAAALEIELGARKLTDAHLQTYLTLCGRCRARLLRFVVDAVDYEPSLPDLTALLRNATPALEAAGVTLAVENHDRFPVATLRGIVDAVGSLAVGVCLDTANSLGAGEGLSEVLRGLAPVTVNLHVKDVAIARLPHMMGFTVEGRALGRGQLAIREAMAVVAAESQGRCRSAVLEGWTPPLVPASDDRAAIDAARDATVRTELAWVDESITTLKRWLVA